MPRIKPMILWMAVYPSGELVTQHHAGSRTAVCRGLADTMKGWRELEAKGWRVVQVKIAPVVPKR